MPSSRFFCSNFSFFVLGPYVEHFFLLFSNLLLVFQYLAFFFYSLFLVGVPDFFLSLELSSFLSAVSFFGRGITASFFELICLLSAVSFFGRGSTVVFLFFFNFLFFGVDVLIVQTAVT